MDLSGESVDVVSECTLASESSCEGIESGSSCTSLKSQGVCHIKLMAFIFQEIEEAEEDAKADVQTRRTNLHMKRLECMCTFTCTYNCYCSHLVQRDGEKWFTDHIIVQLRLFDVRSISLKQGQVRADGAWNSGTSNSRSKCQVSRFDVAPQTTMSSCQGICIIVCMMFHHFYTNLPLAPESPYDFVSNS